MRYNNSKVRQKFYTGNVKMMNQIPDLPFPNVTKSSDLYPTDEVDGHGNARTAFNKLRSYDITVDKIDLKIAGAATIYGKQNNKQAFVWQSDEVGLYTSSLNENYQRDNFRLLSTIYRDAAINYWGIDFLSDQPEETKRQFRGVRTWINNTQTLVQQIKAAQTTDLSINTLEYQPQGRRLTNWSSIFTPLQMLLINYQTELYVVLTYIQGFVTLTACLPKFQELYHKHAIYFVHIQNELGRAKYKGRIKSLMTWIKRRWVDRSFYKEIIAPTTVVSKKTDGLNSPILYLVPTYTVPAEPMACSNSGYSTPSYEGADFDIINKAFVREPERGNDNYIINVPGSTLIDAQNKVISRAMNSWTLDTILELILRGGNEVQIMERINKWLDEATATLEEITAACMDFIQNNAVVALEAALSTLSTAPGIGAMNWVQNIDVNPIPPIMEFADWEFTNELVLLNVTKPESTANGYSLSIPMFKMAGIQKQIQFEYFQSFYLASDESYMSYVNVSDRVYVRFRDYTRIGLVLVRDKTESTYHIRYMDYVKDGQITKEGDWSSDIKIDANYASQAFQDKFVALQFKTGSATVKWVNPSFMAYVQVNFTSRATEFEIWNTQNYIIPLG